MAQQVEQTGQKPTAYTYSARRLKMLGLPLEGMDPTCSLRSIDEKPPRFLDYRIVPKIQMVDHVTSEPTISYRWGPRNRVAV
jgi:hypothetical protein